MKFFQFFEDENGQLSSMRLYSFIALITAIVLTFTNGSYEMVLTYLIVAFGGKSTQKIVEDFASKGRIKK